MSAATWSGVPQAIQSTTASNVRPRSVARGPSVSRMSAVIDRPLR